jgi:hypothetical protein
MLCLVLCVFKYSNSEDQMTLLLTGTLRLASGAFQIYCKVDISIDLRAQLFSNMINDCSGRAPSATFIVFTPFKFKLTSDVYNTFRNMEQYLEGQS